MNRHVLSNKSTYTASPLFHDVCKITIFYSDKMVERVTRTKSNNVAKFQVSESLCLAINNIDYVLQYIQPIVLLMFDLIN